MSATSCNFQTFFCLTLFVFYRLQLAVSCKRFGRFFASSHYQRLVNNSSCQDIQVVFCIKTSWTNACLYTLYTGRILNIHSNLTLVQAVQELTILVVLIYYMDLDFLRQCEGKHGFTFFLERRKWKVFSSLNGLQGMELWFSIYFCYGLR